MKHRIALILVLSSLSATSFAISPCQEKEQDIQREISYADKHHNQHRIAKQQAEISERQNDLREAEQKGDADKISKRQRKLDEAQQELKALQSREY